MNLLSLVIINDPSSLVFVGEPVIISVLGELLSWLLLLAIRIGVSALHLSAVTVTRGAQY